MRHRLLVVSYLGVRNSDFVRILQTVRDAADFSFRVTTCQTASELFQVVGAAFGSTKQISRLDLHGHAGPGEQRIGNDVLANRKMDLLGQLDPYLTDDAEIRLLGCGNALGTECFEMLKGIQARQGECRTVYACKNPTLQAKDFDRNGLRDSFARKWLIPVRALTEPIEL